MPKKHKTFTRRDIDTINITGRLTMSSSEENRQYDVVLEFFNEWLQSTDGKKEFRALTDIKYVAETEFVSDKKDVKKLLKKHTPILIKHLGIKKDDNIFVFARRALSKIGYQIQFKTIDSTRFYIIKSSYKRIDRTNLYFVPKDIDASEPQVCSSDSGESESDEENTAIFAKSVEASTEESNETTEESTE